MIKTIFLRRLIKILNVKKELAWYMLLDLGRRCKIINKKVKEIGIKLKLQIIYSSAYSRAVIHKNPQQYIFTFFSFMF